MPIKTAHKIALASAAYRVVSSLRRCAGRPQIAQFKRRGLQWELDLAEGIDFSIYLLGAFELRLVRFFEQHISPGAVVFDIGANIGAHTLPLARAVGESGKVHAFEATEFAVTKLGRNLALNPELTARVKVQHAMLTATSGENRPEAIPSSWPLSPQGGGDNLHPVHRGLSQSLGNAISISLDDYAHQCSLNRLDWIKIDVDGHELSVLTGAVGLLKRFKPAIIMEFAPDYQGSVDAPAFDALIEFLHTRGYQAFSLSGTTSFPMNAKELVKIIPPGSSRNVLLRVQS